MAMSNTLEKLNEFCGYTEDTLSKLSSRNPGADQRHASIKAFNNFLQKFYAQQVQSPHKQLQN
jgi:hypothetical protein